MKGFAFDPGAGTLTFRDGVRDALVAPDGTLINLLPDEFTLTNYDTTFPDVPKDRIYRHTWSMQRFDSWSWYHWETGNVTISALPQDWASTVVLADAPARQPQYPVRIELPQTK